MSPSLESSRKLSSSSDPSKLSKALTLTTGDFGEVGLITPTLLFEHERTICLLPDAQELQSYYAYFAWGSPKAHSKFIFSFFIEGFL